MTDSFLNIKDCFNNVIETENCELAVVKQIIACCKSNKSFEIVGLYRRRDDGEPIFEIIVVDCLCVGVPSKNKIGIKNRERLAICCSKNENVPHMLVALRKNFPPTVHQVFIDKKIPNSLCLYDEPWNVVERTWTPEQYLQRIEQWLELSACGKLHQEDQPVERLFFQSHYTAILPSNYAEKLMDKSLHLSFMQLPNDATDRVILSGDFIPEKDLLPCDKKMVTICLRFPSVVHRQVDFPPVTLGQLHESLENHGLNFLETFRKALGCILPNGEFFLRDDHVATFIICFIPIKRAQENEIEDYQVIGFVCEKGIYFLSTLLNLSIELNKNQGKCIYASTSLGQSDHQTHSDELKQIEIHPVHISSKISVCETRKNSGVKTEQAEFSGVIGGVGSLGGNLAELWSREGWGQWTLIDDDILEPHNISRHIALDCHVGSLKVKAVEHMLNMNYEGQKISVIPQKINDFSDEKLLPSLKKANLIVDASTTLDAPRDLSRFDDIGRCVSVFFSPSGLDSVILLESKDRKIRLDAIEAQYYRAIINNSWGDEHLNDSTVARSTGTGCRETSRVLPYSLIKLHSGLLSSQLKYLVSGDNAAIKVFQYNEVTGDIMAHFITCDAHFCEDACGWKIVYDEGISKKLFEYRNNKLPNETGGIIVGYHDQVSKAIYVVDVLSEPADSESSVTGFTRGCDTLSCVREQIKEKTGFIVDYIGDWHSHPQGASVRPSCFDVKLLKYLRDEMKRDGLPALMLIVGDNFKISLNLNNG